MILQKQEMFRILAIHSGKKKEKNFLLIFKQAKYLVFFFLKLKE